MAVTIGFWVLAVVAVAAALTVVLVRDVFRAALSLMVCFVAVAGIYITLSADFLAAVQILIYIGGISILIILAIMMTREMQKGSPSNRLFIPAFLVAIVFLGIAIFAMVNTPWVISTQAPTTPTTGALAARLLGQGGFILPLEISGILLLVAVIGSIVMVREK